MPNVRVLDATDLAALLPPAESPAILQAALVKLAGDGVGGLEWSADATRLPGVGPKAPAGSAALLAGGAPRLFVERRAFEARRGAAITGLAARRLADPRSEVLTLLGCNATGRAVFEVVRAVFPGLERVLCYDPDVHRQAQFADEIMTTFNVASIIPPEPREASEGAQILVGCPEPLPGKPVVESDWIQRGTLVVMLHGASAFTDSMLQRADRRIVDDLGGWRLASAAGRMHGVPEPEGDLCALAAGRLPARAGSPVIATVCFGSPALDAALAAALLARADKAGRGRTLAL
jgi:ornithine cyclodeaminase/alanine dehydrogenase-like protein (mu-crystallin family)